MREFDYEQIAADEDAARRQMLKKHGPKGGVRAPKQRADGEGTVFPVERKRKDGKTYTVYRAAKTIELGPTRKKITAQAPTAREAIASREAKILKERVAWGLASPAAIPANPAEQRLTVADCMLYWLSERRNENLAEATIHMYDARIRNHILPEFGAEPVRGLTYPQLKRFFSETLPAKGLGVDSIRQTFICLKSALDYYLRDGILHRHPMVGLRAPAKKAKTAEDTLKIRQASKTLGHLIIQEARKDGQELRWILGLLGLRQAEVLGLTDDCFVERDGLFRLVIKQQLQRASATHGCQTTNEGEHTCGKRAPQCPLKIGDSRWVLKSTKTASGSREIALTTQLWVMIYEHIKKVNERREQPGFHPDEGLEKLIFIRADGRPIYGQRDRTALSKLLDRIEYKYGLPEGMTVHTLRHMATTKLIDGGADEGQLIATMGWSAPNARAQIATYSSADYAKKAAAMVGAYLDDYLNPKKPDIDGWDEL